MGEIKREGVTRGVYLPLRIIDMGRPINGANTKNLN